MNVLIMAVVRLWVLNYDELTTNVEPFQKGAEIETQKEFNSFL